jgi:hypothetical protein
MSRIQVITQRDHEQRDRCTVAGSGVFRKNHPIELEAIGNGMDIFERKRAFCAQPDDTPGNVDKIADWQSIHPHVSV